MPSSIAICEKGFSKQIAIKRHLHNRLNLKTLDALMRVSLCELEVDGMDCAIINIWKNIQDRRILTLDSNFFCFFFVWLQIKIVIWLFKILIFLKYCVNPKLRWHFRIKCMSIDTHFCFWKHHVTLWISSWTSNEICQTYSLVPCSLDTWTPIESPVPVVISQPWREEALAIALQLVRVLVKS